MRPEDVKHIRFVNIGAILLIITNFIFLTVDIIDGYSSPVIATVNILASLLCLFIFKFQAKGRYTLARCTLFCIFYISALFTNPLSGKEVVDHYFIFVAIGYAFVIFPKDEKHLMLVTIFSGVVCYAIISVLYLFIDPVIQTSRSSLILENRIITHAVFLIFILGMLSSKYLVSKTETSLMLERRKLSEMAALLKQMFGRYLSPEVMESIIEDPSSLALGGERRRVTIVMTDLRGFTSLSERLEPEEVVVLLNTYYEVLMDVILDYKGTINKIIGDALLIVFGAPLRAEDHTKRAVACAIEMQNKMETINALNRQQGLPELEMGIGINETEVIVGNIGSSKRSSYTVVGSGVNMTSRIESYSVGGQILISESVKELMNGLIRIDAQREVTPKGADRPIKIYEVGSIAGDYHLVLEKKKPDFIALKKKIPVYCHSLEGRAVGEIRGDCNIIRLSPHGAEIATRAPMKPLTNLEMNIDHFDEKLANRSFYGKIMDCFGEKHPIMQVRFTAVPPEIEAYFRAYLELSPLEKSGKV